MALTRTVNTKNMQVKPENDLSTSDYLTPKAIYDSRADTLEHIKEVNIGLINAAQELLERAKNHDTSKLNSPEKEYFDIYTPKLKDLVFGSEEYKQSLEELKPALDHHYKNNSHHPQYYNNGINGMDLFDLIEMLVDWEAAGKSNKNGNIIKSIEINKDRFGISEQLTQILINTVKYI